PGGRSGRRSGLGCQGKGDAKGGAAIWFVGRRKTPAMRPDDGTANGEAQSQPLPLRCDERLKESLHHLGGVPAPLSTTATSASPFSPGRVATMRTRSSRLLSWTASHALTKRFRKTCCNCT